MIICRYWSEKPHWDVFSEQFNTISFDDIDSNYEYDAVTAFMIQALRKVGYILKIGDLEIDPGLKMDLYSRIFKIENYNLMATPLRYLMIFPSKGEYMAYEDEHLDKPIDPYYFILLTSGKDGKVVRTNNEIKVIIDGFEKTYQLYK